MADFTDAERAVMARLDAGPVGIAESLGMGDTYESLETRELIDYADGRGFALTDAGRVAMNAPDDVLERLQAALAVFRAADDYTVRGMLNAAVERYRAGSAIVSGCVVDMGGTVDTGGVDD